MSILKALFGGLSAWIFFAIVNENAQQAEGANT